MAISSLYDSLLTIVGMFVDIQRFGETYSTIIFLLGFGVVYFIIQKVRGVA